MATMNEAARTRGTAAELVRSARSRRRFSQRELARLANVPQSTVANIESGRRQPSVAMLERLLAAAGFRLGTKFAYALHQRLQILIFTYASRQVRSVGSSWTLRVDHDNSPPSRHDH